MGQVRDLKAAKGFEVSLEQRLAYLMAEVGEVSEEVLKLSRDGNGDVGRMSPEERDVVVRALGAEVYDVLWNLLDLADLAGVDVERAFEQKARMNSGRKW